MNEEDMNGIVGFRFHPNDEELITHYLNKKIQGLDSVVDKSIAKIEVLKYEPEDLPAFSKRKSNDPFWYFFCQLDYKYLNSKRANRKTEAGFWKVTGKDCKVKSRDTQQIIGIKKTLVFYRGRVSKKSRTNWVMHEYHITPDFPNPEAYVICRLERKADRKASTLTPYEVESSHQSSCQLPSNFGNHVAENTVVEVDPLSQADPRAIADCDELDSNLFSELIAQLDGQDHELSSDWTGIQTQFDITEPQLSNNFSSNCNAVQTQFCTTEQEEDFAFMDSYLVDEFEAYPEETVSHKKLVVESEGLNFNRDVSSPHLLESLRGMPYIEDCHEVAIAQPREVVERVIATDMPTTNDSDAKHEIELEWASWHFFIFSNTLQLSHNSPQLSHNSSLLTVLQQRILMQK